MAGLISPHTPAQLLNDCIVLDIIHTAYVLGLKVTRGASKGEPSRPAVYELIRAGRLKIVDDEQPITRWTVSCEEIRRYQQSGGKS